MQKLQLFNKQDWKEGPWQREADLIRWIDPLTHLPCSIIRSEETGVWCGYVAIDYRHPLYMVNKRDATYEYIDVHGGISFADFLKHHDTWIVPMERRWWIGFDCMKKLDLAPRVLHQNEDILEYRTEDYVHTEVSFLAQQLQLME